MPTVRIILHDASSKSGKATQGALILLGSADGTDWVWTQRAGGTLGNGDSGGSVRVLRSGGSVTSFRLMQDGKGNAFMAVELNARSFPPTSQNNGFGKHAATRLAGFPDGLVRWNFHA